jgi:hypothetical protein
MDKGSLDEEVTYITGTALVTRAGFEDSAQPTVLESDVTEC